MEQIQLKRYPAYKDSGVEWLGEIPEHWQINRLRTIANIVNGATPSSGVESYWDGNILWVTPAEINDILYLHNSNRKISDLGYKNCGTTLVPEGSIILTTRAPIGKVALAGKFLCTNQGCKSLVLKKGQSEYLYFQLLVRKEEFNSLGKGTTFMELSNRELKDLLIIFPPFSEQTRIAEFLDRKTALIDKAVDQKERLIALLKERRQILIHNAVTRGLNPDAPMKDSGVAWIGEIPAHWEVKKIKHVTLKIGSGITPSGGAVRYLDSGVPLLRSQNILWGRIELDGVAYISEKVHQFMKNSQVKYGDVLLNITGASIGRCHYVEIKMPLNVNQHVCIIRPNKEMQTVFLNYIMSSNVGQRQIWFYQQGGGREGLNFQALKNFYIPFPPQKEQAIISQYVEKANIKIETAITNQQAQIEKLKEYKATLINSAVTGKIRV